VVNKWDKVLTKPGVDKEKMMEEYMHYLKMRFEFLSYVTPIFTSAVTGKRLEEILESAIRIKEERLKRVKTSVFNSFIEQIVYKHPPT
jgi:GTP-binding protein